MSDQREWLDWRKTLASTRALVTALEDPLTLFWEPFEGSEKILADLEPPLSGLVDFLPFAQLALSSPEHHPVSAKPTVPRTAAPLPSLSPSATVNPTALTTAVGQEKMSASQSDDSRNPLPVFTLPGRKGAVAPVATTTSHSATQPLPQGVTPSGAHLGFDEGVTVDGKSAWPPAITPAISPLHTPALTQPASQSPSAAPAQQTTVAPGHNPLGDHEGDGGIAATVEPLETMTLLATLTATLLSTPVNQSAARSAMVRAGETMALPFPSAQSLELGHVSSENTAPLPTVIAEQARGAAPLAATVAASALSAFSEAQLSEQVRSGVNSHVSQQGRLDPEAPHHSGLEENQFAELSSPAVGALNQPDAWTLAQLINDVLTAEARRHGVDLS